MADPGLIQPCPVMEFKSSGTEYTRKLSMPDSFYMMSDGTVISIFMKNETSGGQSIAFPYQDLVIKKHMDLFEIAGESWKRYNPLRLYDARVPTLAWLYHLGHWVEGEDGM